MVSISISIVLITQILSFTMHNIETVCLSLARPSVCHWIDAIVLLTDFSINWIQSKKSGQSEAKAHTMIGITLSVAVSFVHSFGLIFAIHSTLKTEIHTNNYRNIMNVLSSSRDIQHNQLTQLILCLRVNVSLLLLLLLLLHSLELVIWCEHLMWCRNRFQTVDVAAHLNTHFSISCVL